MEPIDRQSPSCSGKERRGATLLRGHPIEGPLLPRRRSAHPRSFEAREGGSCSQEEQGGGTERKKERKPRKEGSRGFPLSLCLFVRSLRLFVRSLKGTFSSGQKLTDQPAPEHAVPSNQRPSQALKPPVLSPFGPTLCSFSLVRTTFSEPAAAHNSHNAGHRS